jgi:ion channel
VTWFRIGCAIVYVLLLFGFAIIYDQLPNENFYHANLLREPVVAKSVLDYKEHIRTELEHSIIDTFQQHYGNTRASSGNWGVDSQTFRVRFLEATEKGRDVEISFKLSVRISDKSRPTRRLYVDPIITFSAKSGADIASSDAKDNSEQPRNKTIGVEMPDTPGEDEQLWDEAQSDRFPAIFFPTPFPDKPSDAGSSVRHSGAKSLMVVTMPIPKQLDGEILDLANGILGDPSRAPQHFRRMFYLSAVTITTLGYGDIAPLTTTARTLISLEAVLGILVLGFLISGGPQKASARSTGVQKES